MPGLISKVNTVSGVIVGASVEAITAFLGWRRHHRSRVWVFFARLLSQIGERQETPPPDNGLSSSVRAWLDGPGKCSTSDKPQSEVGSNSSFRHVYRVGVGVTRTEPTASHGETFGFLQGGSADSVSLAIGLMSYQARRTGFDRARSPGARHFEKLSPGDRGCRR